MARSATSEDVLAAGLKQLLSHIKSFKPLPIPDHLLCIIVDNKLLRRLLISLEADSLRCASLHSHRKPWTLQTLTLRHLLHLLVTCPPTGADLQFVQVLVKCGVNAILADPENLQRSCDVMYIDHDNGERLFVRASREYHRVTQDGELFWTQDPAGP